MRSFARALRQVRAPSGVHRGALSHTGLGKDGKVLILGNSVADYSRNAFHGREIGRYLNQSTVLSRSLSTPAANDSEGYLFVTIITLLSLFPPLW